MDNIVNYDGLILTKTVDNLLSLSSEPGLFQNDSLEEVRGNSTFTNNARANIDGTSGDDRLLGTLENDNMKG